MKSKEEKELDNDAKIGKAGGADGGNTMGLGGMLQSGIGGATGGLTAGQVKDVEEALIENAKEAERQRKFLEKEAGGGYPPTHPPHSPPLMHTCTISTHPFTSISTPFFPSLDSIGGLKHRLLSNHTDVERAARARLRENSNLLYECNDLRREVKQLERQLDVQGNEKQDMLRQLEGLRKQLLLGQYGQGGGNSRYLCHHFSMSLYLCLFVCGYFSISLYHYLIASLFHCIFVT